MEPKLTKDGSLPARAIERRRVALQIAARSGTGVSRARFLAELRSSECERRAHEVTGTIAKTAGRFR